MRAGLRGEGVMGNDRIGCIKKENKNNLDKLNWSRRWGIITTKEGDGIDVALKFENR